MERLSLLSSLMKHSLFFNVEIILFLSVHILSKSKCHAIFIISILLQSCTCSYQNEKESKPHCKTYSGDKNTVFFECRFIKHFIETGSYAVLVFVLSEKVNAVVEVSSMCAVKAGTVVEVSNRERTRGFGRLGPVVFRDVAVSPWPLDNAYMWQEDF